MAKGKLVGILMVGGINDKLQRLISATVPTDVHEWEILHDNETTEFRLTILGGLCGGLTGTLIAFLSLLTTKVFLWYAWVFSPLMLCLFGVAIVAWWNRARWFEQTSVHRQFTALLGEPFGRSGGAFFW